MASILQGVYKRSLNGQASSSDGSSIGKLASVVAELGVSLAERYESAPNRLTSSAGVGAAFATMVAHKHSSSSQQGAGEPAPGVMMESEYAALKQNLVAFMHEEVYPNEGEFARQCHAYSSSKEWTHPPLLIDLMRKAKQRNLWNLWLPVDTAALVGGQHGAGLTNLQYADLCEIQGTSIHGEMAAQYALKS